MLHSEKQYGIQDDPIFLCLDKMLSTQMPFSFVLEYLMETVQNFKMCYFFILSISNHYLNTIHFMTNQNQSKFCSSNDFLQFLERFLNQQQQVINKTPMQQKIVKAEQNSAPNHTRKLGNKQFALYLKSQPRISTYVYNVEKYLSTYEPFYYDAFLSEIKGRDLDTLERLLAQQYSRLIEGKSFLHKINNAVFSRKKCLQKVKRDLTKVQSVLTMFQKCYFRKSDQKDNIYIEYTQNEGYTTVQIDQTIEHSIKMISNLFIDISRLRDMTIYIIETVHRWRVGIEEWMDRCQSHARIDFYISEDTAEEDQHSSVRIYDALQGDTDFLWNSRLSEYIWMQFKHDPLIIRNVLNVSQRPKKEVLQKYFVQILYPSSEQVIDKTIKAVDMLNHIYKPKEKNLYQEQEKLIQNYLGLQRKNNEEIGFEMEENDDNARAISLLSNSKVKSRIKKSQSQSKITVKKQFREQIKTDNEKWQEGFQTDSPYANKSPQKINPRGWVFGKQLKKPASDRIRDIIKKHQVQMTYLKNHKGIIKPFNITNFPEKKSIALAYLNQKNNSQIRSKEDGWIYSEDESSRRKQSRINQVRNIVSEGQDNKFESQIHMEKQKQAISRKRMYQSLVKVNAIIVQDPKQHENDQETPKNKITTIQSKKQRLQNIKNRFFLNKKGVSKQKNQVRQELSKTIDKKDAINGKNSQIKKISDNVEQNQAKTGRNLISSGIKINSMLDQPQQSVDNLEAEIEIEGEQTPLNMKQFFQVFRADTKEKPKNQSRVVNQLARSNLKKEEVKQLGGSIAIRKAIDKRRSQSLKNVALLPYYTQKKKKPNKKDKKNELSKSKSQNNSQNSFKSYQKVDYNIRTLNSYPVTIPSQHLNLKTKQITKDIITKYVNHICSHVPVSCQSFTNYHTLAFKTKMIQILEDPAMNSLIFDIEAEKDGKIGQAVVVQTISSNLKMRYTIEFINVDKFQMLAGGVCRIAQELLATSPCQQVVFKLFQDKTDPVSTHFIALIDESMKRQSEKFSYFNILEKGTLGLTHQTLYERIYILQPKQKNIIKQQISLKYKTDWRRRVAGSSYRSLVFQTKCVALTSNFKLRSESLNKAIIQIYKEESIGILFVILLQKIMTKYHLKQLKVASLSVNDADETTGLVKKSPFLRSIFYELLHLIKSSTEGQKSLQILSWMKSSITKFTSMTDLLNYLSYKEYDQAFKFDFLVESRFILNHELTLSQINLSTSLDFVLENSTSLLLINNHHNFIIEEVMRVGGQSIEGSMSSEKDVSGFLLPTTDDNLKIFFMSAKEYLNCSDSLDLYSYLQLLFRESIMKQRHDIRQMAIPDLTKRKTKVNNVKMYDGFLRLFPQRQFYSGSMIKIQNLWQNFYPNAVISKPISDAIIIDYPIIVGFYDNVLEMPVVSYLLKQQK